MTDPQVRQLAEQWLRDQCLDLSRFCSLTELLEKVASHTRREALREAANLTERSTRHKGCKDCEKCLVLKQAATAIRLLAEEKR